jgi:hypothetical protein
VNYKGRAAYRGVIGKAGLDAQIFGGCQGGKAGSHQPIDIVLGEASVLQGVICCLGVVLER